MKIFIVDWSYPDQTNGEFYRTSCRKLFKFKNKAEDYVNYLNQCAKEIGFHDGVSVNVMEIEVEE